MTRDIKQCVPELQEKWPILVERCKAIGIDIFLVCTSRTETEQAVLYLNGVFNCTIVNQLRHILGWGNETNRRLTRTIYSKHVITKLQPLSRAIDFGIKKNGVAIWNVEADGNGDGKADYRQVGAIAEELGLNWLDEINDYGHIEVR